jgi:hypothetical protein
MRQYYKNSIPRQTDIQAHHSENAFDLSNGFILLISVCCDSVNYQQYFYKLGKMFSCDAFKEKMCCIFFPPILSEGKKNFN